MNTAFRNIFYSEDIGNSPASVNLATGDLYLNPKHWDKMKKEHKIFILLHELGHYVLQSKDEFAADEFAFYHYKKLGYPLSESIYALSENLTGNSPEHESRVIAQGTRSRLADENSKMNLAAFEGEMTNEQIQAQAFSQCDGMLGLNDSDYNDEIKSLEAQFETIVRFNECNAMSGKLRRNRCNKKRNNTLNKARLALTKAIKTRNSKMALRNEKRKSKQYKNCFKAVGKGLKKAGKGSQRSSQGQADKILAEQGIDSQANKRAATMEGISGMVDSIAGIFGGGSQGQAAQSNQTMMIVIAMVLLGAGAYFLIKKPKKSGNTSKS